MPQQRSVKKNGGTFRKFHRSKNKHGNLFSEEYLADLKKEVAESKKLLKPKGEIKHDNNHAGE